MRRHSCLCVFHTSGFLFNRMIFAEIGMRIMFLERAPTFLISFIYSLYCTVNKSKNVGAIIIPKYLKLLACGINWSPKYYLIRSFTLAFVKLCALLLPGFIFISISTAHSPNLFRSVCDLAMSLLSTHYFPVYYTIICEQPYIRLIVSTNIINISEEE